MTELTSSTSSASSSLSSVQLRDVRLLFHFFASQPNPTPTPANSNSNSNSTLFDTTAGIKDELLEQKGEEKSNLPSTSPSLSPSSISSSSRLSAESLHSLLSSLGLSFSLSECRHLISTHSPSSSASSSSSFPFHSNLSSSPFASPSASPSPSTPAFGLTFDEFVTLYGVVSKTFSSSEEVKEVFRMLDSDRDGFITLQQLRHVMIQLSTSETAADGKKGKGKGINASGKANGQNEMSWSERENKVDAMLKEMWPMKSGRASGIGGGGGVGIAMSALASLRGGTASTIGSSAEKEWLNHRVNYREFVEFMYR